MDRIAISPTGEFSSEGINFVIDMSAGHRRVSDLQAFTIVKSELYLRFYEELACSFSPRSILELGVFQGGGYVLLDKLFKPERMSAVDISAKPVAPLVDYCGGLPNRFVHFATSQSDRDAIDRIVREELAGELDFVVDDASHAYEHTRASFEFLFPLLRAGGIYIIEDWGWAHAPQYQAAGAPFANRPALSNLLFEQIMLLGSTGLIAEMQIFKPLCLIRKGTVAPRQPGAGKTDAEVASVFDQILSRGKKWTLI